MPGKDDPLDLGRPRVTMWLDRAGMEESRDNYFRAWLAAVNPPGGPMQWRTWSGEEHLTVSSITKSVDEVRVEWDIAYAAAVAAFDFLMSGKLRPG